MLDKVLYPASQASLNPIGARLARWGVHANAVTLAGLIPGVLACAAITQGMWTAALILILLNRLCDGLDGAIARANGMTDFGGYLDIVTDFIFYASIPAAFALHDPTNNAAAAVIVMLSFTATGSSFLAYAILTSKHAVATEERGRKSFYYLGGLTEGSETILFFVAICLFPAWFSTLAYIFAGLCALTALGRIHRCYRQFAQP